MAYAEDAEARRLFAIWQAATWYRQIKFDAVGFHFRRFVRGGGDQRALKVLIRWANKRFKEGKVTEAAFYPKRLLDPEEWPARLADAERHIARIKAQKAAREARSRRQREAADPAPAEGAAEAEPTDEEIRAGFAALRAKLRPGETS